MLQHPADRGGEERNGRQNSQPESGEKRPRKCLHRPAELEAEQHGEALLSGEAADRFDEFAVDAEDEGHGSAGDTRHDVGSSHDEAA